MHGNKGSACAYPHPPMCFKYIKRGPKVCAKGTSCKFAHPKLCCASLVSGKCNRNYFYHVTGSARSNHMNATSNSPQNKMHGSNYHPTPLMQVRVPPPHVPKPISNAPQTNTASSPPKLPYQTPTCSYYLFFRRAKGSKISNVADATNPESGHAKYAESDAAPFALPKTL